MALIQPGHLLCRQTASLPISPPGKISGQLDKGISGERYLRSMQFKHSGIRLFIKVFIFENTSQKGC